MNVVKFRTEEDWQRNRLGGWEMWERNTMGLMDSPYHAYQAVTYAKSISLGDRRDSDDPFSWDRLAVNLLGLDG